jgi:peptidoglycan/LPS O-acetylase OafA/YrhL
MEPDMSALLPRTAAVNVAALVLLLLLVPAAGMLFGSEVKWGIGDFIAAGALLFGAGMAYVIASRKVRSTRQRALVAVGILMVLAVVWAELAVGLFH